MKLHEAKVECQRWFDYLQRQADKSKAIQALASERRKGTIDELEARRCLRKIDLSVVVYDGANLEKAVRVLLTEQDALIQKHLSTLTELEAAVKERDAQLAAAHKMMTRLAKVVEYVSDNEYAMAECHEDWREAINDTLYSYQKSQATRQPTQDKGGE